MTLGNAQRQEFVELALELGIAPLEAGRMLLLGELGEVDDGEDDGLDDG